MTIVAISGQLNAGKDVVADCFVWEGYTKIALADPMKRLAYDVFDFSEDQLWGPSNSRNEVDYRFSDRSFWEISELCLQYSGPKWLKTVI